MTLKSASFGTTPPHSSKQWFASGNAWTTPWSVIAIALCPHSYACLIICFASETPSISLILVWQWSSTRFSGLVSILEEVNGAIFLIPATDAIVSSLSKRSMLVTPFNLIKFLTFTPSKISSTCSFLANSFIIIESVKSVIANIIIVFSPRMARVSRLIICPRMQTSPISVWTELNGMTSSSKSLP